MYATRDFIIIQIIKCVFGFSFAIHFFNTSYAIHKSKFARFLIYFGCDFEKLQRVVSKLI